MKKYKHKASKLAKSLREPFCNSYLNPTGFDFGAKSIENKHYLYGIKNPYKFSVELKRIQNKLRFNVLWKQNQNKSIGGGFKRAITIYFD